MSTATITCICGSVTPEVVLCSSCHRYWQEGRELYGVTSTIRAVWPTITAADPDVLENARVRGVEVDALITAFLLDSLPVLPSDTREDVKDLFLKFIEWWAVKRPKKWGACRPQVIVSDGVYAGTVDLLFENGPIVDVKCTYNIQQTHEFQLGGYRALHGMKKTVGILHLTKRINDANLFMLDGVECHDDWRTIRNFHQLMLRKKK